LPASDVGYLPRREQDTGLLESFKPCSFDNEAVSLVVLQSLDAIDAINSRNNGSLVATVGGTDGRDRLTNGLALGPAVTVPVSRAV